MDIPLIYDRIILFALHRCYTLTDGLELLTVVVPTRSVLRHAVRRLVPPSALAALGRVDLLSWSDHASSQYVLANVVSAAAAAGHVPVLEWARTVYPGHPTFRTRIHALFVTATMHAQLAVMDWCVDVAGLDLRNSSCESAYQTATHICQPAVLQWLKDRSLKATWIFDSGRTVDRSRIFSEQTVERQLATLDWWKAEYAARQEPLFPVSTQFPIVLTWATKDGGLLLVDWWRQYCDEDKRQFQWPLLDDTSLRSLVRYDCLPMCQWWWARTVAQIGVERAAPLLHQALQDMCELGRMRFLDWYWSLTTEGTTSGSSSSSSPFTFWSNWYPRRPLVLIRVIEWWEAKIKAGLVDPSAAVFAFDPALNDDQSRLDRLLNVSQQPFTTDVDALAWWWARRDRFGLNGHVSSATLVALSNSPFCSMDVLQWCLDHCTGPTSLPSRERSTYIIIPLVSRGRVDIADQIGQLLLAARDDPSNVSLCKDLNITSFPYGPVPVSTVMDYVWDIHCHQQPHDEPLAYSSKVLLALSQGRLDVAKWFYTMHLAHGTGFPSMGELVAVKCTPGGEVQRWIGSLF